MCVIQVPPDSGKIVEKHAEHAFGILSSVHDAEDVSQDVFTEATSSMKTL